MIKRIIKGLSITVAVLAALWLSVWYGCDIRRVAAGDQMATISHDLGVFVQAHGGRLPVDWREFDRWWQSRDGRVRWPAVETEKRLELLPEPYAVSNGVPWRIRIKDPLVKGMEGHVNFSLFVTMKETNEAN